MAACTTWWALVAAAAAPPADLVTLADKQRTAGNVKDAYEWDLSTLIGGLNVGGGVRMQIPNYENAAVVGFLTEVRWSKASSNAIERVLLHNAGQAVAMVHPLFFRDDLAAGRLVQPFSLTVRSAHSYWLVYPKARRRSAKIEAFRDWVLSEVAGDSERAAPAAKMGTGA